MLFLLQRRITLMVTTPDGKSPPGFLPTVKRNVFAAAEFVFQW
jgi:hypothetical protein